MTKKITVIGAGPGGYVAAIKAAKMGAEVTVIEKEKIGGTCLNRGCIPTKSLIASAEALETIKEAENYGIKIKGEIIPDINAIIERKDKIVERLNKGIEYLFEKNNVKLIKGEGKIVERNKVRIKKPGGEEEIIESHAIIIATGSVPGKNIFPFDGRKILTSDEILNLRHIPKSILIVGAGVIGCEFAMFYQKLGTEVTIVELLERALATEDAEISKEIEKMLKRKKIKLYTKTKIKDVEVKEEEVIATLEDKRQVKAEIMLVAIGRKASIEGIGLEEAGVKTERGRIIVDEKMRTNVEGIYAIGDVVPGLQLAHVASFEGICAAENIMGKQSKMDYSVIPHAIFTEPEIGAVGLTEEEARNRGYRVRVGRFYFRGLGRAQAADKINGFVKIVADEEEDTILGAHIIGQNATDIVHEAALAMACGVKVKEFSRVVHSHPTFSEALMEAVHDVHGESVHNA
ncbi:dihydrolipoyl dehydrogenase, partial [Thermovenabulum gondwanense]|uniref:dihydrolipoyl dehydrogenase n=1 Tax=Thermovenabulum gondwanense TaxID=520767 RepID=UPI000839A6EB